jgi:small GTP-binding protein
MINENEEDKSKYKVEYLGENFSKDLLTYKVIVLGLYGVGKTSIIYRLMKKESSKEYEPTISLDVKFFQVKVNDKIIQIQIWDCCGNDEFALNTPNLFKNASVAILVYAINDKEKSFNNLQNWYNMLLNNSYGQIIFLIGNKNDLADKRNVPTKEGENYKNNYDDIKMFFETSAKSGENIDKLLENIAISIYEKIEKEEKEVENKMNDNRSNRSIKLKEKNHKKKMKKKWIC